MQQLQQDCSKPLAAVQRPQKQGDSKKCSNCSNEVGALKNEGSNMQQTAAFGKNLMLFLSFRNSSYHISDM
jgi:hypothetical protein